MQRDCFMYHLRSKQKKKTKKIVWSFLLREIIQDSVMRFFRLQLQRCAVALTNRRWGSGRHTVLSNGCCFNGKTFLSACKIIKIISNKANPFKNIFQIIPLINNLVDIPLTYYQAAPVATLRGHTQKYVIPFARTLAFQRSFFPDFIGLWNLLPQETVGCVTLDQFRRDVQHIQLRH